MPAISDPSTEVIVGVDTHKDQHSAAAINALGQILATIEIPTTTGGFEQLLGWAQQFGVVGRVGVEGTGAYGAGLCLSLIHISEPTRLQ